MATFSQFKTKYIVEKRGGSKKQFGQEGTRNIDKKFDLLKKKNPERIKGGAEDTQKFIDELDLDNKNKTSNTTTNRRGRNIKKKQVQLNKTSNQNISTNSVDDSVKSVKTNRTTVNKTTNPNVTKGSGDGVTGSKGNTTVKPNTNTVTNTKKTVDVKSKIDQALKDYQNKLKNKVNTSNVNVNQSTKPNVIDLPKTNTSTRFSKGIGNVTNISKNKGVQLPGNLSPNPIKDNKISRDISRIADRNKANQILKNVDTSDLDTQKLSKKAFKDFKKDSSVSSIKRNITKSPRLSRALKFGGPVLAAADSAISFRNTYKQSQAQGDAKRRSLGKAASTVAGGLIGGALGAAGGSAIAPGAGTYVGGYGGYVAGQKLGQKAFDTLTTSKGRKQIAKSFKNFRNKAMKPVGG